MTAAVKTVVGDVEEMDKVWEMLHDTTIQRST
jgi:hypothetical protein